MLAGIFGDYISFTFRIFYAECHEKSRYFLKRYKLNISHTLWESGQTLTTSAGKIPVITLNSVFFVSADRSENACFQPREGRKIAVPARNSCLWLIMIYGYAAPAAAIMH